jgi:hypothetical protein
MESPARAERVWLAMSLATFYLVIIGGEVDASICESTFPRIHYAAKSNAIKPNRKVSIFRLGWITVILSLIRHKPLRIGCFIPEQWTESPYEIMIHKETYPLKSAESFEKGGREDLNPTQELFPHFSLKNQPV